MVVIILAIVEVTVVGLLSFFFFLDVVIAVVLASVVTTVVGLSLFFFSSVADGDASLHHLIPEQIICNSTSS